MTERLYYNDPYLTTFTANIVELTEGGRKVYLDRTAFYPSSGGQPFDRGILGGIPVVDVVDEEERIAHHLEAPLVAGPLEGEIEWTRRHDHMQQHTGQHLVSAVAEELYGITTISFHLGEVSSTIDIGVPALTPEQVGSIERRANEIVWENRPVTANFEEASQAKGLRKPSDRQGMIRIVTIKDIDRSACGGTHVRSTAGIGTILLRKLDKIRGSVRMEFLCGGRAVKRARADFEILSEVASACSSAPNEVPGAVTAALAKAHDLEKSHRKLALELAAFKGKQLYESGQRRIVDRRPRGGIDDEIRALAQSFTAGQQAVYLAVFAEPPAVMLAASNDSGIHAGSLLKKALDTVGGRGGGNAQLAQGSVPNAEALERLLALLQQETGS